MKLIAQINKLLPYFKKPSDTNSFDNILVVSNSGLGDTILSTPSIVSLRNSFPDINITFMVNKKMFPLFDGFEFVDSFVLYSSGFFSQLRIINNLRKRKIDTIFLFHSNGPEDIFFSVCSGAKNILKMTDNPNHEYKKIFLNFPNLAAKHDIEKKLDLVRLFNPDKVYKKMLIPKHFYSENSYLKKDLGIKYIGMQLGAQDIYKMWPVDNFICLAEKICKEFSNIKFVMLGSTKYEQNLVKKFQLGFSGSDLIVNLCGNSSIKSLPKILNDLDLVITNDTGTLHLAIALEIKTVSLFGPTDSKIFGPYQDFNLHKLIQVDGSFVNNLPKKQRGQEGMELIDADQVLTEVVDSLIV